MKKYKSYSIGLQIISFLGILLGLWMFLGTIFGLIKGTESGIFVEIMGLFLAVGGLWILLENLKKITITDDYISIRNIFFSEKKMLFSEIKKYEVSVGQYEKEIILYSDTEKLKIPFCKIGRASCRERVLRLV